MPNWCENNLCIHADKETQEKILSECISIDNLGHEFLDFEKIIPSDKMLIDNDNPLGAWGTDRNSTDCFIDDCCSSVLSIEMMTAWTPPIGIANEISKKYHCDTRLEYYELGLAFRGIAESVWIDGELHTTDDSWNMTEKDYDELDLLPEEEAA